MFSFSENMLQTAFTLVVITLAIVSLGVNSLCPPCSCDEESKTVACYDKTLKEVPITLNRSIEFIFLGLNEIQTVDSATLQYYPMLKSIDLSFNDLYKIADRAFSAQTRLIFLHLNHNRLCNLTGDTFYGLISLSGLYLNNNILEELPNKVFNNLTRVYELDLSHNRINRIDPEAFEGMPSLKRLYLNDNQLTKLPTPSFQYLGGLVELYIGTNNFMSLSNDSFAGLNSLTKLDVTGAGLVNIPTKQLSMLNKLEELYIGKNPFNTLPPNCFKGLVNLKHLEIRDAENLVTIESGAFADNLNLNHIIFTGNKKLKFIGDQALPALGHPSVILRNNSFTTFKESQISWPLLSSFDISDNPIHCECSLLWMRDLLRKKEKYDVLCSTPQSLKDKPLGNLSAEDFGCSTSYHLPTPTCTCIP